MMMVVWLCHQVPSLLPRFHEIRNKSLRLFRLLVERIVVTQQSTVLVNGFEHRLHILHTRWRHQQLHLVPMLDSQFRHALDMICGEQIVVQRLIIAIQPVTLQVILPRVCIIFNPAREVLFNKILIPRKRAGYNLPIVNRRVLKVLVYLLETHRPSSREQVNDV